MWSSEELGALGNRFFIDAGFHLVGACGCRWIGLTHHQMRSRLPEGSRIPRRHCVRLAYRSKRRNARVLATVTAKLV